MKITYVSSERVVSKPDVLIDVVILGDFNVGKTSTISRLAGQKKKLSNQYCPLSLSVRMDRGGKQVIMKITDTGGQEKYRSLTASYYRGAHGCLLLFDVTKESSFDNVQYWLHDLREYTSQPDICVILVGTKCHVSEDKREVTFDRAHKFAESISVPYMEVSAEEGINVTEVFEKLADNVIDSLSKDQPSLSIPTKSLTLDMPKSKKQWCSC